MGIIPTSGGLGQSCGEWKLQIFTTRRGKDILDTKIILRPFSQKIPKTPFSNESPGQVLPLVRVTQNIQHQNAKWGSDFLPSFQFLFSHYGTVTFDKNIIFLLQNYSIFKTSFVLINMFGWWRHCIYCSTWNINCHLGAFSDTLTFLNWNYDKAKKLVWPILN